MQVLTLHYVIHLKMKHRCFCNINPIGSHTFLDHLGQMKKIGSKTTDQLPYKFMLVFEVDLPRETTMN